MIYCRLGVVRPVCFQTVNDGRHQFSTVEGHGNRTRMLGIDYRGCVIAFDLVRR